MIIYTLLTIAAGYGALAICYDILEWREQRKMHRIWIKHNRKLH